MSSLIYLLIIRLATLAIGAMTLYLGYRLLIQQNSLRTNNSNTKESGSVSIGTGDTKIEMKNVASGIFFAGFGAFLVSITIIANPPKIELKHTQKSIQEKGSDLVANNQANESLEKITHVEETSLIATAASPSNQSRRKRLR